MPPKILIVDDEQDVRDMLGNNLPKHFACETILAADGYEAIRLFDKHKIDLILLDMRMPGINGSEVIKEIRKKNTTVPIFVVSAWEGGPVEEHIKEIGGNGYIPKPVSLSMIRAKVEDELKKMGKYVAK